MGLVDPIKRKAYLKTWVEKNKTKVRESRLLYMKKLRDQVYDHYGRVCACCGETNQMFLSVDHKLNDGASDRKKGFVSTMLNLKIVKAGFPDIYQILCMNCNFGKGRNKGVCPHVS